MTAVRILEQVSRPAPIGLRFRDVATGQTVSDGLRVTVTSQRNPGRRAELDVNGRGIWYARRFPGFSDEALAADDWTALVQPCLIEVEDRAERFLPMRAIIDLPARGIVDWPGWPDLPQGPLAPWTDGSSPPVVMPDALPLFSSAARIAPAPLVEIRAQLSRDDDGGPAAWALVTAAHGGAVRAIGMADAEGRVALFFPYPERPRASLVTSPPAITDFRWAIELAAYWDGLDPAETPEFGAAMAQLLHPRELFGSTLSPPQLLPSQLVSFGRPLVARTEATPDGPSSTLVMAAS